MASSDLSAAALPARRLGTLSTYLLRNRRLRRFLALSGWRLVPARGFGEVEALAGWGYNRRAEAARSLAARRGLPYLALEDGFLRSPGLGVEGAPPFSLLPDLTGVYYDCSGPSDLEAAIGAGLAPGEEARALEGIARLRRLRLSKFNLAPPDLADPPEPGFVLVVDQTFGDASIRHGGAEPRSFARMLEAARDENPGARILLKTHPDVLAGKKRGHFEDPAALKGVGIATGEASPWALIERAASVYVVSSQMGAEALFAQKPVRCFGLPFYAGWGATQDDLPAPARRLAHGPRGAPEIFAAGWLRRPLYYDPRLDALSDFETIADLLAATRDRDLANRRPTFCLGMAFWKPPVMRAYFGSSRTRPQILRSPETALARARAAPESRILVWAGKEPPGLAEAAAAQNTPLLRVEDGFLRSIGLGADLLPPASLVTDAQGIYYDPTRPSDLESLIQEGGFSPELLERAAALRGLLAAGDVSKYNLGGPARIAIPEGRRVVLVVGQVEDDASILKGGGEVRTNLGLLQAARAAHPEAFLIYKPHPDVEALRRKGAVPQAALTGLAEAVARDSAPHALILSSHEVWTMTSLLGFEALLRGRSVTCLGAPFYAGWGLTRDLGPIPSRRTRRATLDELTAAALILHPIYLDPLTGLPSSPELTARRLLRRDPRLARHATPARRLGARIRGVLLALRARLRGEI
ncbi:capsular polysaccharide biosynthesis protein [Neomegalonema sp.]|uniref:capsular polysaccharide biosynthesis protein n=1 Tax=Neomegalonema sp. TaxID=2039713 RepID=UPI002633E6B7|nr:capsular polysaccharide biosynthesis protein [Neomegalonema sp.]MDD2867520.1 capsular polysaccharide biosynthesis protein [Neomegalonema sp.]